MCTITVDATENVARVIFESSGDTGELGVLVPGYVDGQPITIPEGTTREITIFNGKEYGPIFFTQSFSGAVMMQTMVGTALIAASYLAL